MPSPSPPAPLPPGERGAKATPSPPAPLPPGERGEHCAHVTICDTLLRSLSLAGPKRGFRPSMTRPTMLVVPLPSVTEARAKRLLADISSDLRLMTHCLLSSSPPV